MSSFLPWMAPYSGWTLMLLMALAGVMLALRGPRPRRIEDGAPHCSRCEYNLTGLPEGSLHCPECGFEIRRASARTGRALRWPWWIAGAFVALTLPVLVVQYRVRQQGWEYYLRLYPLYSISPNTITAVRDVGGYRAELVEDRRRFYEGASYDEKLFRLRRNSTTYFEGKDWYWSLGPIDVSAPPPRDLNGNGIEDLVVTSSTGGAHCCGTVYIFELASHKPTLLARIDTAHGFDGFADLDGDGIYEIITRDWTFAYWKTSFAGSPAPKVVLSWNGETFAADASRMRVPAPAEETIRREAGEAAAALVSHEGEPEGPLIHSMLDLIYTGHAERSYDLLEQVWPSTRPGREQFRRELLLMLAQSPHRELIESLGHPPLPRQSEPRRPAMRK